MGDMKAFKYPKGIDKTKLIIAFAPSIFLPDLHHESTGLVEMLKLQYRELASKKTLIVMITPDLHYSLAEAKKIFGIPFILLSDPCHTVSRKVVGTFNAGAYLVAASELDTEYVENVHYREAPYIALV